MPTSPCKATALAALKTKQFHRIPLPDRFTLCLAWSARNADTRSALAGLIQQMSERMVAQLSRAVEAL